MDIELWFNGENIFRLRPEYCNDGSFISKPFDRTLWLVGINRYYLLCNGYKRIGRVFEPRSKN